MASVTAPPAPSGAFWPQLVLLVVAGLVVIGLIGYARRRRRTRSAGPGAGAESADGLPPGRPSVQELAARSTHLLVETDDAVRVSDQELGFAIAQFGQEPASQFIATLEAAKRDLAEAFRVRSVLDAKPTPGIAERYRALRQIMNECGKANALLDGQSASFEQLRDLEHTAPHLLEELDRQLDTATAAIETASATLNRAGAAYAPRALHPVTQNPEQARELLTFAVNAMTDARADLAAGRTEAAAAATRSAEEALGLIDQLNQAVARRMADLAQAAASVAGTLAEVEADLQRGRRRLGRAYESAMPQLTSLDVEAARIKAEAESGPGDPLELLARLQAVYARLDELLLGRRSDHDRRADAQAVLDQAILAARSDVTATEDYVTTRRGVVSGPARARQAEASRRLGAALNLAPSDPTSALQAARQASEHARDAQRQAEADLRKFTDAAGGRGGAGADAGGVYGALVGGLVTRAATGAGRAGGVGGGGSGPGAAPVVRRPGGFRGARARPRGREAADAEAWQAGRSTGKEP